MFVHLGGNVVVDARDVVAILDTQRLQRSPDARALLGLAGRQSGNALGSARSLVVTVSGLHPAPISPTTAARRIARLARLRARLRAER